MGNLNTFSYYNVVQSPPSHTGSVVEARRSIYQFPHRVSILPLEAQFTVLTRKLGVNSIHLMDLQNDLPTNGLRRTIVNFRGYSVRSLLSISLKCMLHGVAHFALLPFSRAVHTSPLGSGDPAHCPAVRCTHRKVVHSSCLDVVARELCEHKPQKLNASHRASMSAECRKGQACRWTKIEQYR